MGPDRAAVIAQWRISGIGGSHGPQAESGIQSWTCHQPGDQQFLLCVQDAGAEQVPDIASQRVDWLLRTIQRKRGIASISGPTPEHGAEPTRQLSGPRPVAIRSWAPKGFKQSRTADCRLVRVTLRFTDRDRPLGHASIVETD